MRTGWISIHRQILDQDLWLGEKFTRGQAWVDLILLANHKNGFFRCRGVRVDVKRGQCGHGAVALSERWKWSRGKVIRFLKELENDGNIVQQKTNVTTLITIAKYNEYQNTQDSKRSANGQQTDINNNDNNDNKGNKDQKIARFAPPSITELQNYITEKNLFTVDVEIFVNHYQQNNWMVGKNKMKSWKLALTGWHARNKKQNTGGNNAGRKLSAVEQVEQATRSRNNSR